MVPEKDTKIYDWGSSLFWFDEEGILCSISKKSKEMSLEEAQRTIKEFKLLIGDKKVCMLADTTDSSESPKEIRDFAAEEFPKFIKAIAFISRSPLGKMLGNLFFAIYKQPYPVRMFKNEEEAKEWLRKYL